MNPSAAETSMSQPLGSSTWACCIRHPRYLCSVSIKVFALARKVYWTAHPAVPSLHCQLKCRSYPQPQSLSTTMLIALLLIDPKSQHVIPAHRAEGEDSKALSGGSKKKKKEYMCLCKCSTINRAVTIQASQTSCLSNQRHWEQLLCSHYADTVRATNSPVNQGLI